MKLSDLNNSNLQTIYALVIDIESELQIHSSSRISVSDGMDLSLDVQRSRKNAILFLKRHSIITLAGASLPGGIKNFGTFDFTVDIEAFEQFKNAIKEIYSQRFQNNKSVHNQQNLYWIKFSFSNEIILNDLTVLSQPNLNGENASIFNYLMEHPNKTITKKELEKHIGQSIGKDLHKVVENLGFKGDFKKAFFKVAKDSILFRNALSKSEFEELGISPLKTGKK